MENENQNDSYQKPKPNKGGRKPKVNPNGDYIEKLVPRNEVVHEVSYSAGRKLREKKPMSEKQQDNITKLIALNAERKKMRDQEKLHMQEQEEKKHNEVKVITKIKAKRPYVRREVAKQTQGSLRQTEGSLMQTESSLRQTEGSRRQTEGSHRQMPKKTIKYDPYEDDDEEEEEEQSTDAATSGDEVVKVKKYARRLQKINKVLNTIPEKQAPVKKSDYGDLMKVLF